MTFEKGHDIQPSPSQLQRRAPLSRALREAYTPERVVELIDQAWASAYSRKSPRSMAMIIELIANYAYGKPAQAIELQSDATDALAMLLRNATPVLPARQVAELEQDITYENPSSHKGIRLIEGELVPSTNDDDDDDAGEMSE